VGEEGNGITVHVLGMAPKWRGGHSWSLWSASLRSSRSCASLPQFFTSSQPRLGERFGRSEATALQAIPQGSLLVCSFFLFFLRCISLGEDTGRRNSP